jgi:hypothetical protein
VLSVRAESEVIRPVGSSIRATFTMTAELLERSADRTGMTHSVNSTNGNVTTPATAAAIELTLTLEEARLLRAIGQLGMRAARADGGSGGTPQAQLALDKLITAVDAAEKVSAIRSTLEQAGFETGRLSDDEVSELADRLAGLQGT